jgi:hypothetical protein
MSAKNNTGAIKNNILLLLLEIISFKNNFNPSASGCNNPITPTTEGPLLPVYWPLVYVPIM